MLHSIRPWGFPQAHCPFHDSSVRRVLAYFRRQSVVASYGGQYGKSLRHPSAYDNNDDDTNDKSSGTGSYGSSAHININRRMLGPKRSGC